MLRSFLMSSTFLMMLKKLSTKYWLILVSWMAGCEVDCRVGD